MRSMMSGRRRWWTVCPTGLRSTALVAAVLLGTGAAAQPVVRAQSPDRGRVYLPITLQGVDVDDLPTPVIPTFTPTRTATSTPTLTPSITPSPTLTLTPSITPSPTNTSTATLTPTPTITPTATLVPTATLPPPADLIIGYLRCDTRDEYVRITNVGGTTGNLRNWEILSVVGPQRYSFGSYLLGPGESVTVHSGPDAPSSGSGRLRWTTSYIWNNDDDEAELYDPQGNLVDDRDC